MKRILKHSSRDSTVVKIDSELLKKVEELIQKEEHRFHFTNKKQFIDRAVYEFLKNLERGDKNV